MESGPAVLDESSVLAAARTALREEIRAGCRLLVAAAQWADLHPGDSVLSRTERVEWFGENALLYGGPGTPEVAETAAGGLGVEIGMNPDQARNLIADALDARDRMPEVWDLVQAGLVRRDTVHRLAMRTRYLSAEQAADISSQIAGSLPRLVPGQRLDNLIDAQVKRVDAQRLENLAAEAVHHRYVRKSRPDPDGMADLSIHTTEADARAAMAAVTRLAKILRARQDHLPAGVPVRDARSTDTGATGADGRDGLDEWRAVAAQLLHTNPGLAVQIQLQADQPDLFDAAADTITNLDQPHAAGPEAGRLDVSAGHIHDQPELGEAGQRGEAGQSGEGTLDSEAGASSQASGGRDRQAVIGEIVRELIKRIDFTKLQPSAVLHVHIADGSLPGRSDPADLQARLARVQGLGAIYLDVVRQWLGQACTVKLQPVIDTGDLPAIDRYEFSPAMREAILSHSPASRFPWSNSLNRRNDLDHTDPYQPPNRGGPPGQTGLHNAGPLTRREHRYKTFGPIGVQQPQPDTHVWKTRHGRILIVNPTGTLDLGTGEFAQAVWSTAIRTTALGNTNQQSIAELVVRKHLALMA